MSKVLDAGIQVFGRIFDVIDQAVEDKDLRAEIKLEIARAQSEYMTTIMTSEHTPPFVKVLYAVRDLLVSSFRPLGSALALGFVGYAAYKGIDLPIWFQAVLVSLFPSWGVSRHLEKRKKINLAEQPAEYQLASPSDALRHTVGG